MSESRNENKNCNYVPSSSSRKNRNSEESRSHSSSSGESRDSEESRSYPTHSSSSSESRDSRESRESARSSSSEQYNNLEDIDRLIESLESSLPTTVSSNPRVNKALETRKRQIEELKQLREQSIRKMEEDRQIRQLESQNDEIQDAINGIKRLLKRRTPTRRNNNSGEGRW